MLYTVSIKTLCGRSYYRGHFQGEDADAAIAKVFRFLGSNPKHFKATAKPYVRRAKRVECGPMTADDLSTSFGDSNCCACWALKWAADITFDDARAAWEIVGARKRGEGTAASREYIKEATDLLGLMAVNIDKTNGKKTFGSTLRTFAKANPFGHYVVMVSGHALALVNGKYLDNAKSSDLRKIVNAYRLLENKPRKLLQAPLACATL